jgi:Zn-dependent M16 (insulinase) family peptidase
LKKLDKPIRPEDAVGLSLSRYVRNITDENRKQFRSLLLELTPEKIKHVTNTVLKPRMKELSICSISGKKQLEQVSAELKEPLKIESLF